MNEPSDFIKEICGEADILCESLSQGYILRLTKGGRSRHIFGSYWDINSAAADRIACDKTACFLILEKNGIPAILHQIYFNPRLKPDWAEKNAQAFLDKHKKVVIKPNQGTKGLNIFLCQTAQELEAAAQAIFDSHTDAALSPYVDIEHEYRVFYINGKCPLVYGKARSPLSWQHNLSQGARVFEVLTPRQSLALQDFDTPLGKGVTPPSQRCDLVGGVIADGAEQLKDLACRAARAIGINFATVDIARTSCGEIMVMEINSGVQAKQLLEQLPELRGVVKGIYREAVEWLMG
ncbi:MAG: hypothetical protein FWG87_00525 [Defluviitaleaceae bacterium]|nr:hypothetical protein [Defluviitaleaceae bacterium]